ncbi:hypothetical protein [Paraburkholderia solisilvae]|nr:hypothetical protein [Paraburkholderia solisilvae]
MKGGVWPNVRLSVIALAAASTFAGTLSPPALADPPPPADRAVPPHPASHPRTRAPRLPHKPPVDDTPASESIVRTAVPPDLDQRRRDGHMTPEERRLLRQHIEDAVRELYKR